MQKGARIGPFVFVRPVGRNPGLVQSEVSRLWKRLLLKKQSGQRAAGNTCAHRFLGYRVKRAPDSGSRKHSATEGQRPKFCLTPALWVDILDYGFLSIRQEIYRYSPMQ